MNDCLLLARDADLVGASAEIKSSLSDGPLGAITCRHQTALLLQSRAAARILLVRQSLEANLLAGFRTLALETKEMRTMRVNRVIEA